MASFARKATAGKVTEVIELTHSSCEGVNLKTSASECALGKVAKTYTTTSVGAVDSWWQSWQET
jgi:hypothetical protein